MTRAFRRPIFVAIVAALAFAGLGASASARTLVKLGTLVPDGSVWDKILKDMGADWQQATGGRVSLRIYAGGVAGDEPDLVRKMRIGQLQAASLTVSGLSAIDKGFEVFEIPMFFDSYDELFAVLDAMRPVFERRLRDQGYVLLNWGQGGWVHVFSKQPIVKVADLKKQKIFAWAGDDAMIQLWRENGYKPVALAATDILTGLQTGMIDTLPTTPLAALSLQWFRQTPYMQDLGMAPLVGATVITVKAWDGISADDQAKILAAAAESEKRLKTEIPDQDRQAVEQMKQRGLHVVEIDDKTVAEWRKAADEFTKFKLETMMAKDLLAEVRRQRDAYRARKP